MEIINEFKQRGIFSFYFPHKVVQESSVVVHTALQVREFPQTGQVETNGFSGALGLKYLRKENNILRRTLHWNQSMEVNGKLRRKKHEKTIEKNVESGIIFNLHIYLHMTKAKSLEWKHKWGEGSTVMLAGVNPKNKSCTANETHKQMDPSCLLNPG